MLKKQRLLSFDDGGSDFFISAASSTWISKPVFVVAVAFPACRGTIFAGNWSLVAFDMSLSVDT